jgi:hypothetical protein
LNNTNVSEDNIESPSNKAYKEYRKKDKSKDTSSQNQANSVDGRELEDGQTFQY